MMEFNIEDRASMAAQHPQQSAVQRPQAHRSVVACSCEDAAVG